MRYNKVCETVAGQDPAGRKKRHEWTFGLFGGPAGQELRNHRRHLDPVRDGRHPHHKNKRPLILQRGGKNILGPEENKRNKEPFRSTRKANRSAGGTDGGRRAAYETGSVEEVYR